VPAPILVWTPTLLLEKLVRIHEPLYFSIPLTGYLVAAALLWGDVTHVANQPYNVLDGADKQASPRSAASLALLNRYTSVLRSYCAAGDPICAGGNNVTQHLNYFEVYTEQAADWTLEMLAKKAPVSSSSSASASMTATATATLSSSATTLETSVKTSSTGEVVPTNGGNGYEPYPTKGSQSSSATGEAYPTSKGGDYEPSSTVESYPAPTPSEEPISACPVVYEYVTRYY
jgi:hypothetical protein